jgi:hypothetical protein
MAEVPPAGSAHPSNVPWPLPSGYVPPEEVDVNFELPPGFEVPPGYLRPPPNYRRTWPWPPSNVPRRSRREHPPPKPYIRRGDRWIRPKSPWIRRRPGSRQGLYEGMFH